MNVRLVRVAAVSALAVFALSACGSTTVDQAAVDKAVAEALAAKEASTPSATPTPSASATPSAEPKQEEEPKEEVKAETKKADEVDFKMPNFTGMVLQDAQDKVQTYGIFFSTSHDLLGSRMQLMDSNWKVCNQTPAAGTRISGDAMDYEGKFDFGSVKLSESCPN